MTQRENSPVRAVAEFGAATTRAALSNKWVQRVRSVLHYAYYGLFFVFELMLWRLRQLFSTLRMLYALITATSSSGNIDTNSVMNSMDHMYIYNLSWEDGETDHRILNFNKDDVVATITTGGDNVLNLLCHDVAHVYTVDLNLNQNYLLEMKIAAMRELTQPEFMRVFGHQDYRLFKRKRDAIMRHLSANARAWWEDNTNIFKNFLMSGWVQWYARILVVLLKMVGCHRFFEEVANGRLKLAEQRRLYDEKYRARFERIADGVWQSSLRKWLMLFIGVPHSQVELVNDPLWARNFINYLCHNTELIHNYFYAAYLIGGLDDDCCPLFMKPEYYDAVRSRLDRITIRSGFLHDQFRSFRHTPTKVILLDHMDWLDERAIRAEWATFKQFTTPETQFLWRSFARSQGTGCLEWLDYRVRFTLDLTSGVDHPCNDRVASYNSTFVATIPPNLHFTATAPFAPPLSTMRRIITFGRMVLHPLMHKDESQNLMDQFYQNQAAYYDAYRQFMLHGKRRIVEQIPVKSGMRVLVLGGGTGDIVEHLRDFIPHTSRVTILDLSHALLEMAKLRIREHNWTNTVDTVEADATTFKLAPGEAPYDVVLITYALTMIPDWRAAIGVADACLAEGGVLAVADFTVAPASSALHQRCLTYMFSHDHVHLNHGHIEHMDRQFDRVNVHYGRGGFPLTPLIEADYYWGVWRKRGSAARALRAAPAVAQLVDARTSDDDASGTPAAASSTTAAAATTAASGAGKRGGAAGRRTNGHAPASAAVSS
jgi:S-adenosylmethionine:diacylglycerol 3-amino-3-carboxypropyl transferase/ubiquinone/menaquinone biosynthesis C-methylase UbiE